MTKRVLYNTVTGEIAQWQDTERYNYADPNKWFALLEVTQEEWDDKELYTHVVSDELTDTAPVVSQAAINRMLSRYGEQRAAEYPPLADFADALVKQNSGNPTLEAEGVSQLSDYVAKCLAVKAKYPKPE
jgi:hypothetical protein